MRVLGLISGTSVDGVDAAVAELRLAGDVLHLWRIGHATFAWPGRLQDRIRTVASRTAGSVAQLCRLDRDLGVALGEVATRAVARFGPVALVASHGQTLHHDVDPAGRVRGTLQLGQPAEIAERTGLPVVADFRVRDVAAGGQGAPLVSLLDQLLLAGATAAPVPATGGHVPATAAAAPVAALNLGGIANLTVVRPGEPTLAFDCGPGNALLDAAMATAAPARGSSREPYDTGGMRTARGTVDPVLLAVLRADPYPSAPPPKSTGKERYHAGYLSAALARAPVASLDDRLATLAAFTAQVVAADAARYRVRRVFASGGGVHNAGLMDALRRELAAVGAELASTEQLGLPVDAKEAYAFAVLGWLTWHGLPGNLPSCTGAAAGRVLGAITPGAGALRLPAPLPAPPRAVVIASGAD